MQIYILIDNKPKGPYTPGEVRKYLKTGRFQPATLGAYPGSSDWKPLDAMVRSWGADTTDSNLKESKKFAFLLFLGALVLAGLATAVVKTINSHRQVDIQGAWEGVVEQAPGVKLRGVLHISATNGSYHATLDNIDQRVKDISLEKFAYNYPSLEFEYKEAKATYQGKLNARADEMSGTWKQGKLAEPLVWKRTATPTHIPELLTESDYAQRAGSDLQGYWKGTLQAGPVALRMAFKISEPVNGQFVAEIDSLDQGANNFVVSSVTYDRPKVRMEVGSIGGVFQGKVSSDGAKIAGTWIQSQIPLPLMIERSDPKTAKANQVESAALNADNDYSHTGPDDLPGHWKGALEVQKVKLHVVFHIAKLPDGTLSATMESPDQGGGEIPATTTQYARPKLNIEWKAIGGVFSGTIKNGKLTGKWRQGGASIPLILSRD